MADRSFQLRSYITYWLDAVDEHSLHSPFFYDFYTRLIRPKRATGTPGIESLRKKLLNDKRPISDKELGSRNSRGTRSVSEIARTTLTPKKFSEMYGRIIRHIQGKTILELGTSLGINTLYLAATKEAVVTTFEGADAIADIATLTFEFGAAANIKMIRGDIDSTLPAQLHSVRKIDFALIDANHRYQPTVRYFEMMLPKIRESTVVVIDDIHYSKEMHQAWLFARDHRLVYASADLFRCGILFFDPSLNKQHVILQL